MSCTFILIAIAWLTAPAAMAEPMQSQIAPSQMYQGTQRPPAGKDPSYYGKLNEKGEPEGNCKRIKHKRHPHCKELPPKTQPAQSR